MGVLLIDPATGVEVSVSLERALALGWPTSDGKPLHGPEPDHAEPGAEEAAPEAEEAVEPVKATKPRKSPAKSTKAKAASDSEAAETW